MSLQLVPKSGMILIEPIANKRPKAGNIELADYYHEPETTGRIVSLAQAFVCEACGNQRDTELAEGDIVLFPPSAGDELEWQGTRYLLIREVDVLARVEEATV